MVDAPTLAHLLKYDSVHGVLNNAVSSTPNSIIIDGKEIIVLNERKPENLPWNDNEIDVVVEIPPSYDVTIAMPYYDDAGNEIPPPPAY